MSLYQHLLVALSCSAVFSLGCGGRGVVGGGESGPEATECETLERVEVFGFEIFKYEASRPNAKASRTGSGSDLPACSKADVMPWSDLTREEAMAACERTVDPETGEGGFSLCRFEDQWNLACGGSGNLVFPYGNVFRENHCNDHKSGSGGVEPSASRAECESPYGAVDMVGNVWEWVADETADGNPTYAGGSFEVTAIAPTADDTCNLKLTPQVDYHREPVGFRCCRDLS